MDVQPEAIGEQLLRDQDAVVGDDDDEGFPWELGEAVRLLNVDAVLGGHLLRGRRELLAAAALRAVGPRDHELDLAARSEAVEDPRAGSSRSPRPRCSQADLRPVSTRRVCEGTGRFTHGLEERARGETWLPPRERAGEGRSNEGSEDGLRTELGERLAPLLRRRAVEDQHPVEVVELVLDHPGLEALGVDRHRLSPGVTASTVTASGRETGTTTEAAPARGSPRQPSPAPRH